MRHRPTRTRLLRRRVAKGLRVDGKVGIDGDDVATREDEVGGLLSEKDALKSEGEKGGGGTRFHVSVPDG